MGRKSNRTMIFLSVVACAYGLLLVFLILSTGVCEAPEKETSITNFLPQYFSCLRLNSLGDFLAGSFAPLAFFLLAGTLLMQARQINDQHDQIQRSLKLTEEQIKQSRLTSEALGRQTEILNEQREIRLREQSDEEFDENVASIIGECRDIGRLSVAMIDQATGDMFYNTADKMLSSDILSAPLREANPNDFFIAFRRALEQAIQFLNSVDLAQNTRWELRSGREIDRLRDLIDKFAEEPSNISAAHRIKRGTMKPEQLRQLFGTVTTLVHTKKPPTLTSG